MAIHINNWNEAERKQVVVNNILKGENHLIFIDTNSLKKKEVLRIIEKHSSKII